MVAGTVAEIGTRTDADDFIVFARTKLSVRSGILSALLEGALLGNADFVDLVCPLRTLERSRRVLAHEAALHGKAARALALHARTRPGLRDSPRWRAWRDRRLKAVEHADGALAHLRLAMSHAEATLEAVHVAGASFPRLSAGWTAWVTAAKDLARITMFHASMALVLARHMRRAVLSEIFAAWDMVVHGG